MSTPTTSKRTICPRCMQSFTPVVAGATQGESCPACRELESQRANEPGRPVTLVETHEATEEPEESQIPQPSPAEDGIWPRLHQEMLAWCEGKFWWARLPLWLYFAYVLAQHWMHSGDYRSVFDALNLGIHELGHFLFRPFGDLLMTAGGTITQCLAPIASVLVFYRQRDFFGISVCACWLATNLWNVAIYAGDARALQLPLVAPGVGLMPAGEGVSMHDWNRMLGRFAMLQYDKAIEWFLRFAATGVMLAGLAFGGWLLYRMFVAERESRARPRS